MFKRYSYQGGVCDPLVIHWPAGHRGARRGPRPVPPLHRHRPDDPRLLRRRDARRGGRLRADAAARRVDALLVRRRGRADGARRRSTTRCSGTRGIWHKGWKAVTEHGPVPIGLGQLRPGPLAALPHRRGPLGGARPGRAAPGEGGGAQGALARGGRRSTTSCRSTTCRSSSSASSSSTSPVPASGRYTYYPGTTEVPERVVGEHPRRLVTRSSPRSSSPTDARGRDLRPGLALRRPRRCSSRTGSSYYVYNFLGIPPEQELVAEAPASGRHIVGVDFTKERMGEHHEWHGPLKLHVDDRVVAEAEIRTLASRFSLCGEGLCIGYDGGDGQPPVHAAVPVQRRADRARSCSTSPTTRTSTSSGSFAAAMARDSGSRRRPRAGRPPGPRRGSASSRAASRRGR